MNEAESTSPDESEEFAALEAYLQRLHRGEEPEQQQLLLRYPHLAESLKCLEMLESFVSPTGPGAEITPFDLSPTLDMSADSQQSAAFAAAVGFSIQQFGHYELLAEIGRGGMGVVFKARQKSLDRLVAIKMLCVPAASADHLRRFQTEARAAAGLTHPNIVGVYEVGEEFGQQFFAMEYVAGQSLAQRLHAGSLPADESAELLCTIARAVEHLHQNGVVHRDLKPSNILMDEQDEPHVTDFGLAKMYTAGEFQTASGVVAGTPNYMSPEQAAGKVEEVGPASDIYSLGAMLYEMLTGRPPFQYPSPLETLMAVRDREPPLPRQVNSHVPRELELVCLKCLEKSPEDRYVSAEALAADLERYLKREGVEARPPRVIHRLWRWARREPALAVRIGAAALFYAVESINALLGEVDAAFHMAVTIVAVLWLLVSYLFQRLRKLPEWEMPAAFLWCAGDVAMALAILLLAGGVTSPAVITLPLLIVASGFWYHVRLVWFMTALTTAAYLVLVARFYLGPEQLRQQFDADADRHVYFTLGQLLFGAFMALQVWRLRVLNQFHERRQRV